MSWRDGPMAGFDTETDGPNPEQARIITASIGIYQPGGTWTVTGWQLQPERPIPAEATAIHGITTDHATGHGQDRASAIAEITAHLTAAWAAGAPVAAFNAAYDFTLLDRESRRLGLGPLTIGGMVIDPYIIDKADDPYRKGSRRLADVARHHGIILDDAHNAAADSLAAARLAWKLCDRLPACPHDQPRTIASGMEQQAEQRATQQASLAKYFRRKGRLDDAVNVEASTGWPIHDLPTSKENAR